MILEAGEATSAITMLEPLIATYPFRDRPRGLLMRALADARPTYATRSVSSTPTVNSSARRSAPSPRRSSSRWIGRSRPRPTSRQHVAAPSGPPGMGPRAPPRRFAASLLAQAQPPIGGGLVHRARRRAGGAREADRRAPGRDDWPGRFGEEQRDSALSAASDLVLAYEGGVWWVELGSVTWPNEVEERLAASTGFVAVSDADVTTQIDRAPPRRRPGADRVGQR